MPHFSKNYDFKIATATHIEGIIEVFTEAFCGSEPMTRYLNMDKERFKIFAGAVAKNAILDQLSIVALDKDRVIACALVEDFADMREVPLDFDPKFKYIAALLEKLGADYFSTKTVPKKCVAHLFITAVDERYRRQGLSTAVNLKASALAGLAGFKFVYSELTNIYNELGIFHHIHKDKRLTGSCIYNEFVMDGVKPFVNLSGGANGYIWEIHPHTDFAMLDKT